MLKPSMQVLIYIEHYTNVTRTQLVKWRKNSLRGILAKLETLDLITKKKKGNETIYLLTGKGKTYIDSFLDTLHVQPESWDKKWSIVSFCIPERDRKKRDKLRRVLQNFNYRNFFGSYWVKPHTYHHNELLSSAKNIGIEDKVVIQISQSINSDADSMIIKQAWNLSAIKKEYARFIKTANEQLPRLKKNHDGTAYQVKYLIFDLAQILSQEPLVPMHYMPEGWPRQEAIKYYKEIRKKLF